MKKKKTFRLFVVIPVITVGLYLFAIMPGSRTQRISSSLTGRMYAHRGIYDNSASNPENSLAAFEAAADMGYGIEMDVQLSADGIPVVFHDETLSRMARKSNGKKAKGKVSDYTIDELKEFHLKKSEQKIPTLAEFLELVDGRVPILLEFKASSDTDISQLCGAAQNLLNDYDGEYCIQSFSTGVLLWYRIHSPETIRGQLSGKTTIKKDSSILNIVRENVLLNFVTKPDFISYNCVNYRNPSRQICRNLYNAVSAGWTVRSQKQLNKNRKNFDLFIFEGFIPQETTDPA